MKLLADASVSAVHVGGQTSFEDVVEGRFKFGMENEYFKDHIMKVIFHFSIHVT